MTGTQMQWRNDRGAPHRLYSRHSTPFRVAFGTFRFHSEPLRGINEMRTFPVPPGTGVSCAKSEKRMTNNTPDTDVGFRRIKGREPRTQSIATRFTRAEEQTLVARAEANGQNLREWARDVLLRVAVDESRGEMGMYIFTELVGIQMLLMSALDPLLRSEKMAPEELAALYRRVQTTKATRAQELLAKRNLKKEK